MAGLKGKTVYVDLGSESVNTVRTDENLIRKYLGGRGLGVKLLSELADANINPLSPENPLIFTSGPLSGLAPMASGAVLTSKSPLTGTIFSWNMTGGFGSELKKAEIDALIVIGKAKRPSYVKIETGNIEIVPAEHLWGMNIRECTEALKTKAVWPVLVGQEKNRFLFPLLLLIPYIAGEEVWVRLPAQKCSKPWL